MALPKDNPELERLIHQAAKSILARDPDFGKPDPPMSDDEYAQEVAEWECYERDVMEPHSRALGDQKISDLIDADRG